MSLGRRRGRWLGLLLTLPGLTACGPTPGAGGAPTSALRSVSGPGSGASADELRRHLALMDGQAAAGRGADPGSLVVDLPGDGPNAALGRKSAQEANEHLLAEPTLLAVLGPLLTAATEAAVAAPGFQLGPSGPPAMVDLRAEMPPVRNQQTRPVCEIFAVCGALDHLAKRRPGLAATTHAPQFLWWSYQRLIASQIEPGEVWGDTGTDGPHMALLLRQEAFGGTAGLDVPGSQGVVDEALAPFNPAQRFDEASGDAAAIAKAHLGKLADRIQAGEAIPADGARARFLTIDVATFKGALAEGHPIVIGVPCVPAAWQGLTGPLAIVPELSSAQADEAGSHAILLVGYTDDPGLPGGGAFRFRNSWGASWGDQGYGRLSYQYVLDHADDPYYLDAYDAPFQARYALGYPG